MMTAGSEDNRHSADLSLESLRSPEEIALNSQKMILHCPEFLKNCLQQNTKKKTPKVVEEKNLGTKFL